MILHAVRWPITRTDTDERADDFFRTLAHLVGEALHQDAALSLPTSTDPLVAGAISYTQQNLAGVTMRDLSRRSVRRNGRCAGVSPTRSGCRGAPTCCRARLLRAMASLAEPGRTVLDVSIAVGFDNVSSFTRAFHREIGESPSAYRRRVAV